MMMISAAAMDSIMGMSDAELRDELLAYGVNVGPVTASTRSLYEKKLLKLRQTGAVPPPITKKQASPQKSKSPVRMKRKSTTTNNTTDATKDMAAGNRRSSPGRRREARSSTEEEEEQSDSEAMDVEELPEADPPRYRISSAPKHSPPKTSHTKPSSQIYPGLLNTNTAVTPPRSLVQPDPVSSRIAHRTPTPPRLSSTRHNDIPPTSYASSSIFSPTRFSDLHSPYLSGSRQDGGVLTQIRSPLDKKKRTVQHEEQEEEDLDYDDGEDGHLESSRDLSPRSLSTRRAVKLPSGPSYLSMLLNVPSRIASAIASPFKASPKSGRYYERNTDYRGAAVSRMRGQKDVRVGGWDVSRMLLYFMTALIVFLLLAYLATVHTHMFINAGRIASNAAVETVVFFYAYAILPTIIIAVIVAVGAGAYFVNQRWYAVQAEEKRVVFDLIEKITDIIRDASEQGQAYVAEPHVRDMLIPPSKRLRDSVEWNRWQQAVAFINMNESRVCTESRVINGVECAVWRWLPAKKTGWQGNAFDGQSQLNVPDQALSHCLKLRGMFPSTQVMSDKEGCDVERSVVQKLAPIRPLHLHVDGESKEGVVFARFTSLSDCKDAFTALHGTWFNGQLVSAKYLRNERYEQRFPNDRRVHS